MKPLPALLAIVIVVATACSSGHSATQAATTTTAPSTRVTSSSGGRTASSTVWLCRPGNADDPCTDDLTTTVFAADGTSTVERARPATNPKLDCFYVYPTVSAQPTPNANLAIDPELKAVARQQASRFSQVCRVFAPVYPQLTLSAIGRAGSIGPDAAQKAYDGVVSAWKDYLAHDNRGRGVVLIGHSQGAGMLTQLISREIEPDARQRRRLVSALLLGGNVIVPAGKDVGGSFTKVPACRSASQTGCVVAYSTFSTTPPANAIFGRAASRFSATFGDRTVTDPQVLCTNPAALGGGSAPLHGYYGTTPFPGALGTLTRLTFHDASPGVSTPWVVPAARYTGRCESAGGATVLVVSPVGGAPVLSPEPDATWGLHLIDVNVALGDLVGLVRTQSRAYHT